MLRTLTIGLADQRSQNVGYQANIAIKRETETISEAKAGDSELRAMTHQSSAVPLNHRLPGRARRNGPATRHAAVRDSGWRVWASTRFRLGRGTRPTNV